ncbi:MAG: acylneuraminate cytidylyltransferase family protein [Gemmatimonadetes bacterium]|nr:acylneuraminate cytidylyltransferase family protein [Gemmatimonadota bacterium]
MTTGAGEVLAIIPARGGSKRLPGKNLMPWNGKPLIVHSIEHARAASLVTRVVVSTDDSEIKAVASATGAEVVDRPADLATDNATSESALLHALGHLESSEGYRPELVVFLQCTSPSRRPGDIDGAIRQLLADKADSLFSACRFERYVWRTINGAAEPINYDFRRRWRDQEFPAQYMENGSIYVVRREILEQTQNRLGGRMVIYEMPAEDSFQVDRIQDLRMHSATGHP